MVLVLETPGAAVQRGEGQGLSERGDVAGGFRQVHGGAGVREHDGLVPVGACHRSEVDLGASPQDGIGAGFAKCLLGVPQGGLSAAGEVVGPSQAPERFGARRPGRHAGDHLLEQRHGAQQVTSVGPVVRLRDGPAPAVVDRLRRRQLPGQAGEARRGVRGAPGPGSGGRLVEGRGEQGGDDPRREPLLQRLHDRVPAVQEDQAAPPQEGSGKLQREERVAPRGPLQLDQGVPWEDRAQPRPQELVDRGQAQGAELQPHQAVLRERPVQAERDGRLTGGPSGGQDPHGASVEPARDEFQHPGGGLVQPLDVVHGDQDRPTRGEGGDGGREPGRDRAVLGQ